MQDGPKQRKIHWKLKDSTPALPRYTEIQAEGPNPLFFTRARPVPLQDVDLSHVEVDEEVRQLFTPSEMAPMPCCDIHQEKMGLSDELMMYLKKTGISALTPVQAKVLQHMHAYQDCAICAPTGCGKTLGICIGLVARIMREGPPVPFQTLFLTPNDELALQVVKWIREMWWYPHDPMIARAITTDMHPQDIDQALVHKDYMDPNDARTVSKAPYIVVATPEVMWRYYNERKRYRDATVPNFLRHRQKDESLRNLAVSPVFQNLDTFVCDEVDSVLPPTDYYAPGNRLLREVMAQVQYQAPLQVVLNSATLAAPTVNHVKKYLRKSLFESGASRIFDDEVKQRKKEAEAFGQTPRHITCPETVDHYFYIGKTQEEQFNAVRCFLQDTVGENIEHGITGEKRNPLKAIVILPESANLELYKSLLQQLPGTPAVDYFKDDKKPTLLTDGVESDAEIEAKFQEKDRYLLCREKSIRGLNFGASHAIVLAQPKTMLEYVHWAGRVGRLGADGYCGVIMQPHFVRIMAEFAETLEIEFKIRRKQYAPVAIEFREFS